MKLIRSLGLSAILSLCVTAPVWAQEADIRIAHLLNERDWFQLERELPQLEQDETLDPMLKYFGRAMAGIRFNRLDSSMETIDVLLGQYQEEMGLKNTLSMVYFYADALWKKGEYGRAADWLAEPVQTLSDYVGPEYAEPLAGLREMLDGMRELPPARVEKPGYDVEIPLITEELGRGKSISVPAVIDGLQLNFIFDTGAGMSGISKKLADKLNVKIVYDSLNIIGAGEEYGHFGTVDSIYLGGIVYRNPVLVVFPETAADSIISFDAILGLDLFRHAGEFRIYPYEDKIVFPAEPSGLPQTGRNLIIDSGQPYVEIISGGKRMVFHMDTGNVKADLHYPYFEAHRERVIAEGEPVEIFGGGFAGMFTRQAYRIPEFNFTLGAAELTIRDMDVYTEGVLKAQNDEYGAFGYSLLEIADEAVFNFDQMFVAIKAKGN